MLTLSMDVNIEIDKNSNQNLRNLKNKSVENTRTWISNFLSVYFWILLLENWRINCFFGNCLINSRSLSNLMLWMVLTRKKNYIILQIFMQDVTISLWSYTFQKGYIVNNIYFTITKFNDPGINLVLILQFIY